MCLIELIRYLLVTPTTLGLVRVFDRFALMPPYVDHLERVLTLFAWHQCLLQPLYHRNVKLVPFELPDRCLTLIPLGVNFASRMSLHLPADQQAAIAEVLLAQLTLGRVNLDIIGTKLTFEIHL